MKDKYRICAECRKIHKENILETDCTDCIGYPNLCNAMICRSGDRVNSGTKRCAKCEKNLIKRMVRK